MGTLFFVLFFFSLHGAQRTSSADYAQSHSEHEVKDIMQRHLRLKKKNNYFNASKHRI